MTSCRSSTFHRSSISLSWPHSSPRDEAQAAVLKYVTFDPIHIDEITRNSALAASTVSSALTMMELRGLVRQVGGMNYTRLREAPAEYQNCVGGNE